MTTFLAGVIFFYEFLCLSFGRRHILILFGKLPSKEQNELFLNAKENWLFIIENEQNKSILHSLFLLLICLQINVYLLLFVDFIKTPLCFLFVPSIIMGVLDIFLLPKTKKLKEKIENIFSAPSNLKALKIILIKLPAIIGLSIILFFS